MSAPGAGSGRAGKGLRIAGFVLASALFVAAAVGVWRQSDAMAVAWRALWSSPGAMAGVVLLPVVCLGLATASFHVLTTRYGKVTYPEMFAVLASAWLLNYLPMKPGVAGRVAYHKVVNGIAVRHSLAVAVQALVVGVGCFALMLTLGLVTATRESWPEWARAFTLSAPALFAAVAALVLRRAGDVWWRYAASFCFRYLDSMVWALRYWLLFRLMGHDVGVSAGAVLAVVGQSASLVPLVGNGLGLREWGIGLATETLPSQVMGASMTLVQGLSLELMNRAGEVAAAVPLGLACSWWMWSRVRGRVLAGGGTGGAGSP